MSKEKNPTTTEPAVPAADNAATPDTGTPNNKAPKTEVTGSGSTVNRHVRPGHPLPNGEKGEWDGFQTGFSSFGDW